MNLGIEISNHNDHGKVIELSGEIDVYTAPNLKETLLPLTEVKGQFVQVDFTHVTYMDSTGIGVFISALKSSKQHESKIQLVHMNERILRLFEITGLIEIMDVHSSNQGEANHGTI